MNALRHSPWTWATCRKTLCAAAGLAALAGSALADDVTADTRVAATFGQAQSVRAVKAEIPAIKNHKVTTWSAPELPTSFDGMASRTGLYGNDSYTMAMNHFDNGKLFRTRKEMLYRDTLRLLLTKRQVRVWLRDNLHVQCEVKRWRSVDDGRELGLKLGMYYRFD